MQMKWNEDEKEIGRKQSKRCKKIIQEKKEIDRKINKNEVKMWMNHNSTTIQWIYNLPQQKWPGRWHTSYTSPSKSH